MAGAVPGLQGELVDGVLDQVGGFAGRDSFPAACGSSVLKRWPPWPRLAGPAGAQQVRSGEHPDEAGLRAVTASSTKQAGGTEMRKLVEATLVSLDGVVGPPEERSLPTGVRRTRTTRTPSSLMWMRSCWGG